MRRAISPAESRDGTPAAGRSKAASRRARPRANVEELLAGVEDAEGAFRMPRSGVRLSEAGRERLETEVARLLEELEDPAAPYVDLIMLSARQG